VISLLGRYFHYFYQRKLPSLLFYVDMRILIDKKNFYMLNERLILCKYGNILLSLTLKDIILNFFVLVGTFRRGISISVLHLFCHSFLFH